MASVSESQSGFLLLEDGTLFHGRMCDPLPPTVAEVVFTTNMTGYQEDFTDRSYQGQVEVLTASMIGTYGVISDDRESAHVQVAGVIVREMSTQHSNWRATGGLREWLAQAKVPLLED